MKINILFLANAEDWRDYEPPLKEALLKKLGPNFILSDSINAEIVDYIIYSPNSSINDFTPFKRCKAILNLWAGVETLIKNKTIKIPLTRMVDEGLKSGMVEWVVGHILRHHLGMDNHILNENQNWLPRPPPLAKDRITTVLGIGALGSAVGTALRQLGFKVRGWSKNPKSIKGIRCYHGPEGLTKALTNTEFVILLLPKTPETENVLNERTISLLKRGAFVINPGRGALINDGALLKALDCGQLSHATLDVFRIEPLPIDHPFWFNSNITVTPHIAAATRPAYAAEVIVDNIKRSEKGQKLLHLVDLDRGY